MQSLHKKNKATFSKGWIPSVKIEENKRKRAVIPTCLHLYNYCSNNPVRYVDPDGRICYSYYNIIEQKFGITTYSPNDSQGLNILYSILDFYPFGIGEGGKRFAEFLGSGGDDNFRVIDSSTTKGYRFNETIKNALSKYGDIDTSLSIASKFADVFDAGSEGAKILGNVSSFVGNISNYIINPALLGLSVSDFDTAIFDNFIVGAFGNYMYSNTREGVENKYKLVQNEVLQSFKNGNLHLRYCKEKNMIEYRTDDVERFNNLLKKLNEME